MNLSTQLTLENWSLGVLVDGYNGLQQKSATKFSTPRVARYFYRSRTKLHSPYCLSFLPNVEWHLRCLLRYRVPVENIIDYYEGVNGSTCHLRKGEFKALSHDKPKAPSEGKRQC